MDETGLNNSNSLHNYSEKRGLGQWVFLQRQIFAGQPGLINEKPQLFHMILTGKSKSLINKGVFDLIYMLITDC
jgi:hypothetical protein